MKIIALILISISLVSCKDGHEGASHSLKMELKQTEVNCGDLVSFKFSKGYWVRSELDGRGLLVITKENQLNTYTLALMAHGHERALETRTIDCPAL